MSQSYQQLVDSYKKAGLGKGLARTFAVIPAEIGHTMDTLLLLNRSFGVNTLNEHMQGPLGLLLGGLFWLFGYAVGQVIQGMLNIPGYIGHTIGLLITGVARILHLDRLENKNSLEDVKLTSITQFHQWTKKNNRNADYSRSPFFMNSPLGYGLGFMPEYIRDGLLFGLAYITAMVEKLFALPADIITSGYAFIKGVFSKYWKVRQPDNKHKQRKSEQSTYNYSSANYQLNNNMNKQPLTTANVIQQSKQKSGDKNNCGYSDKYEKNLRELTQFFELVESHDETMLTPNWEEVTEAIGKAQWNQDNDVFDLADEESEIIKNCLFSADFLQPDQITRYKNRFDCIIEIFQEKSVNFDLHSIHLDVVEENNNVDSLEKNILVFENALIDVFLTIDNAIKANKKVLVMNSALDNSNESVRTFIGAYLLYQCEGVQWNNVVDFLQEKMGASFGDMNKNFTEYLQKLGSQGLRHLIADKKNKLTIPNIG